MPRMRGRLHAALTARLHNVLACMQHRYCLLLPHTPHPPSHRRRFGPLPSRASKDRACAAMQWNGGWWLAVAAVYVCVHTVPHSATQCSALAGHPSPDAPRQWRILNAAFVINTTPHPTHATPNGYVYTRHTPHTPPHTPRATPHTHTPGSAMPRPQRAAPWRGRWARSCR